MKNKLLILLLFSTAAITCFAQDLPFIIYEDVYSTGSEDLYSIGGKEQGIILYGPGDIDTEDPDNGDPPGHPTDPGSDFVSVGDGILILTLLSGGYICIKEIRRKRLRLNSKSPPN